MIHEKYKLSCGVELDLLQAIPGGIVALKLSKPDGKIDDFAHVNETRVGFFLDPADTKVVYDLLSQIHKPTPGWKKFLNFIFLGKEL